MKPLVPLHYATDDGEIVYGACSYVTDCGRFVVFKLLGDTVQPDCWIVSHRADQIGRQHWNAWFISAGLNHARFSTRRAAIKSLHQMLADDDLLTTCMRSLG